MESRIEGTASGADHYFSNPGENAYAVLKDLKK
jgi:hypothetical protein